MITNGDRGGSARGPGLAALALEPLPGTRKLASGLASTTGHPLDEAARCEGGLDALRPVQDPTDPVARQILADQPIANSRGIWNRTDHRPLEGFVYAITPFNFTAIAGNLPTAPALMGNTVIWKPSTTQQLAASLTMELLIEAGMPPGVINMLPGIGPEISDVLLADPNLAGVHFTGSTRVFQQLWGTIGSNIASYRSYPRLVGETGGKDFVLAHPSADPAVLRTALVRGAFEYSGQKCSAASRAYVPASLWSVAA